MYSLSNVILCQLCLYKSFDEKIPTKRPFISHSGAFYHITCASSADVSQHGQEVIKVQRITMKMRTSTIPGQLGKVSFFIWLKITFQDSKVLPTTMYLLYTL